MEAAASWDMTRTVMANWDMVGTVAKVAGANQVTETVGGTQASIIGHCLPLIGNWVTQQLSQLLLSQAGIK